MLDEGNLNVLLSNIVNEKSFAHCRLCLSPIPDENYIRFEENLYLDESKGIYLSLSEIVLTLMNNEMAFEDIPGIDAVCQSCADEALKANLFIQKCKQSTMFLNKVLINVTDKVNGSFEVTPSHSIYIHVTEKDCQVSVKTKPIMKCKNLNELNLVTELKAHNLSHHKRFTCADCTKCFQNKTEYDTHVDNKLKCNQCNLLKCSEALLAKHVENAHISCICSECGKTYQNITKLDEHRKKYHEKHTCSKCRKSYTTYNFYVKHVELCLNNKLEPHPMRSQFSKDFKCKLCTKAYCSAGSLRVHQRFAHSGEKGPQCQYCGKKFTAPSNLKLHLITHTRERNFPCDICQKRFVSKEALLYHTRRHTGEKPIECPICTEKFVNASARAEHIKFKHVGPKIPCDICSKKFVSQNYLQQHRSRHFDQSSKLFAGRASVPANAPRQENIRNYHIKFF